MRTLSPRTRRTILEATTSLMRERDFSQIPTKELASRAGIAEATLFRYFPRKSQILFALVEEEGRRFFEPLDSLLAEISSPRERLLALCRHHARFACERRKLVWTLEREMTYARPTGIRLMELVRQFLGDLEGLIRQAQAAGEFREDLDPSAVAFQLHGVVRTLLLEEQVRGEPHPTTEAFLERSRELIENLARGLLPSPEAPPVPATEERP